MKKFGRVLGTQPKRAKGKPGQQEMLPSRHAMSTLVGGSPMDRSLGNYAKMTPSGAGAPGSYPAIMQEGQAGADVDDGMG
jgi:hypothetical protein